MFNAKSRVFAIWVLILSLSVVWPVRAESATSAAEKLLTVIPDDVVGFIATSGGDELKPAFEKTILGRIWNDPGVQTFYQSIKKELLNKVKQEVPDDRAKPVDIAVELAPLVLKRPMVIGASRKEAKAGPPIYGFAIFDAGPRKAEIASAIAKLEGLAFEGLDEDDRIEIKIGDITMRGLKDAEEVPAYWGWVENYFVFAINDGEGLAVKYVRGNINRPMPGYLMAVPGTGDALAVYIDREKVFNVLSAIASMEGDADEFNAVKTVIKELGLANIKTIAARMGFSGSDTVCNKLVKLGGPRTGLLASLGTIELSMFDTVDAGAVNAASINCDIGGIYDTVMRAIKVASPEDAYPEIQEGIAEFESEAKANIRRGLIESLAGPMIFYSLPAGVMMEAPTGGVVVIAKLKDVRLWEKTVTALGDFAKAHSEGMLQVSSQVQDGRTFHCWVIPPLAMMQVMPTWTIVNNHVVIGSNTALCNKAAKQVASAKTGGNSLRTTEGFRKVATRLPNNLICFSYTNSKLQFNQMMISIQQFWPMITMVAGQQGIKLPFMLPSLSHIVKDMEPSCQYSWFDAEGLRCRYQGAGIEPSLGAVAGTGIGTGILMPALAKARDRAKQAVSLSNLHRLAICLKIWSDDHKGKLPKTLEEAKPYYHDDKLLESPRKPKDFDGPSYVYIPHETPNIKKAAYYIVVYENPEFCEDKITVLFLDYSVRAMSQEEFLKALEETYEFLGKEMPEIRFKGGKEAVVGRGELPPRVISGSNLSGIGKACMIYANDDEQGRFPSNLQKLVEHDYLSAKQLESPLKPKGFDGPSYRYVAGQSSAMNPGNIVAYENPAFCSDKINVLFIDCRVKAMKPAEFLRELEETHKRLGREMPEVKFKGSRRPSTAPPVAASNLHQIGLMLKFYSDDHKGKFPNTLKEMKPYYEDDKLLESPRKPRGSDGPSYIYVQHETPNIKGATKYIGVYENPEFCRDKIYVLFLDYSVRAMSQEEFLKALEETYKHLGREMPEIRFKGGRRDSPVGSL
jgi:hypothetical protein